MSSKNPNLILTQASTLQWLITIRRNHHDHYFWCRTWKGKLLIIWQAANAQNALQSDSGLFVLSKKDVLLDMSVK